MQRPQSPMDGRRIGVAEETRQSDHELGQEAAAPRQSPPAPYPHGQLAGVPAPTSGAANAPYGSPYVGPTSPVGPGAAQPYGEYGAYGAPRATGALPGFSGPLGQTPAQGQPVRQPTGRATGQTAFQPSLDELANRATVLLQRIHDVELSLTGQEWWLLGKAMPEARLLAALASLLAVALGEMEGFLIEFCRRLLPPSQIPETSAEATDAILAGMNDPRWLATQREQAIGHLRMVAAALPAMSQYARTLRIHAERLGVAAAALDPLTIVMDRLSDAQETLQQPPA